MIVTELWEALITKNAEVLKEEARFKTERTVTRLKSWTPRWWPGTQYSDSVQRSIVSPIKEV